MRKLKRHDVSNLIKKYLESEEHKNEATLTLAKIIDNENPGFYPDDASREVRIQRFRGMIKSLRQQNGRMNSKDERYYRPFNTDYFSSIKRSKRHVQEKDFPHIKRLPSVLVLDIETLPMELLAWQLMNKYRFPIDSILKDWCMLSYACKWLFGSEVMSDILTPAEAIKHDDKRICKSLAKIIDTADIIIAHNGYRFDMRKIKARFLFHGMKPCLPYQLIDTYKGTNREFGTSSHKLEFLGRYILNKSKIETDYNLWKRCRIGDPEALEDMDTYCKRDTSLLEEVYMEVRPWIHSHPNLALYCETDEMVCHVCMGDKFVYEGEYFTPAGRFDVLRCKNCFGLSRKRKSNLTKEEKDKLLIPLAR